MTAEAGEEYDKSLKSQAIPIFEKDLPFQTDGDFSIWTAPPPGFTSFFPS